MAFIYNEAKRAILRGEIDLQADDMRVLLVMGDTTADTERDANTLAGFSNLDEMTGVNYVRKALAAEAVTENAGSNRAEFDAQDLTWTALGAGPRQVVGAVLYKHVASDADSVPVAYIDTGGFPFTASGADFSVFWNAAGILHAA